MHTFSENPLNIEVKGADAVGSIFLNIFLGQAVLYAYQKNLFAFLQPDENRKTSPSLKDIAQYMQLSSRATQAIVSACCALSLLEVRVSKNEEVFKLTSLAETYLLKDSPFWYGGVLEDLIENNFMTSLKALQRACEANEPQITDGNHFEAANQSPKIASSFLKLMHSKSSAPASIWPSLVDLSDAYTMLDIGGGAGTHSIYTCLYWPHLKATVFDLDFACHGATKFIEHLGLEHQITTLTGDMWTDPFPSADIHFYSDILHDWPLEKGEELLAKSYASLPASGRIIIHERLFEDDKSGPSPTAAYNVMMLLWTEGQQLSQKELVHMLQEVGFTNIQTQKTTGSWSITIGHKA